jgi:putative transposase
MTRPLRLKFSGAVYHITAHGDRREPIFLDDADRLHFIDLLSKEVKQRGLAALRLLFDGQPLPHLLLKTPQSNLVRALRLLNGGYTQTFNRAHGLVGTFCKAAINPSWWRRTRICASSKLKN